MADALNRFAIEKAVRKGHGYVTVFIHTLTGELLSMDDGKKKKPIGSATAAVAAATFFVLVAVVVVISATAAATTTAAATAATAFVSDIFGGRHAAQLDGGADVLADLLLEGFEFALGGEEVAGDFVFKEGVAGAFELADFGSTQLDAGVLFVVKLFAALMHALILEAGFVVGDEALDVGFELEVGRITGDQGAEFLGFYDHGSVFGSNGHGASITSANEAGNGHLWEFHPCRRSNKGVTEVRGVA